MQSSRAHYGVLCRAAKSKQQLDLFAAGGWRERGLIVPSADRSRSTRRSWVVWFWLCTQDAFPCPWLPHSRIDLPVSVGVQALGVPYAALSLYRDTGSLLGLWHARRRPRRTTHAWFWQRLGAARRYGHVLLACNTCSWTWWGVTFDSGDDQVFEANVRDPDAPSACQCSAEVEVWVLRRHGRVQKAADRAYIIRVVHRGSFRTDSSGVALHRCDRRCVGFIAEMESATCAV